MGIKGQNIIEFVIIIVLIALVGVGTLYALGGNVNELYKTSSQKSQPREPFQFDKPPFAGIYQKSKTDSPVVGQEKVGQIDVNIHEDGSKSFTIGERQVILSKDVVDAGNELIETSGATGTSELIKDIASLITIAAQQGVPVDEPLLLVFGNGIRQQHEEIYQGTAKANSYTLKLGNNLMMVQEDKGCIENPDMETSLRNNCKLLQGDRIGKHKITGELNGNDFTGKIQSTIKSVSNKDFTAHLNGEIIEGHYTYSGDAHSLGFSGESDWKLDFSDNKLGYEM